MIPLNGEQTAPGPRGSSDHRRGGTRVPAEELLHDRAQRNCRWTPVTMLYS